MFKEILKKPVHMMLETFRPFAEGITTDQTEQLNKGLPVGSIQYTPEPVGKMVLDHLISKHK